MLKLTFGHGDWIVVCDGARALFIENAGDEKFPNFSTMEAREEDHESVHTPHGEGPGRVYESVGSARSAVESANPKERAETEFLEEIGARLETSAASGKIPKLHIVAPPRALGVLRHTYGPAVRRVLGHEVAKDFVTTPVHEIERLLTGDAPGTG
jgi:protein required for attachment to host cells